MKSLNPEIVVPVMAPVSTTKIFDEYEAFYNLLVKRVGEMAAQGKSLDEIKKSSRCRSTPTGPGKTICRKILPSRMSRSEVIRTKMTKARILALAFLVRWLCGFPDAALAQQEIVTLSTRPGGDAVLFSHEHSERSAGNGGAVSRFRRLDKFAIGERPAQIWPGQFSRAQPGGICQTRCDRGDHRRAVGSAGWLGNDATSFASATHTSPTSRR